MAISFVAASTVVTGANPSVPPPVGYAEKDLLVLVLTGTATPSSLTGIWTRIGAQAAAGFITVYVKFALGTEANTVVTVAGATSKAVMLAYRGVSATDVISTFSTAAAVTSLATNTLTTTQPNEYVISIYAGNPVVGTWTAPVSTTSRLSSDPTAAVNGLLIADELQATAGVSTARTATITNAHTLSAVAFSIIPSGRYWVGGSGTWTTTTTNWSFSSGGASGAPAPTANDPVFFDQAATYSVTMTGALLCLDFTVSAGVVSFVTGTTPTLTVSGSMTLTGSTAWSITGLLTFNSTSTGRTITTNNTTIQSPITFSGSGGVWSLGGNLTTTSTVTTTLTSGTLTLNGFNLSTGAFSSNNSTTRAIAWGTNNIYLTHTTAGTTVLDMATLTSYTPTGTAGSFGFILDGSVNRTLSYGSTAAGTTANPQPKLTVTSPGTATITITATSIFQEFNFTGSGATITGGASIRQSLTLSATGTYTTLNVQAKGTGASTTVPAVWTCNGRSLGAVSMGLALTLGPHYQYMNDNLLCTSFTMTAGQWDFSNQPSGVTGPFSLICSGAISITSLGTLTSLTDFYGNLPASFSCTTWTHTGTFSLVSSSITASTSFTQTSGAFTLPTTGTVTTPSFTQTAGTVSLSTALTLSSTYTLTAGTLTLDGVDLTTAIFSSQSATVRSIVFGTNNIYLVSSTAGQTALNLGYTTFTYTGTGGFISTMNVTKTFTATTTPTLTSAVKLYLTSGSAAATFTASSWFDILDFSGYSGTASGTIFVKNMTLSSGGTYTGIVLTTYGTGSYNGNGNTTGTGALTIGTATLAPTATTLSGNFSCGTCLLSTPATTTFNLNGFTLTCVASTFTVNTPNTLLMNAGTINCTTFTTGDSFTLNSGTINPSVSIIVNNGAPSGIFTYSPGGTLTAVPSFIQQNGTVVLNQNYALTQAGTYTFSQVAASGVLTLNNNTLSTGGFVRTVSGANTINFGTSGQILLTGNNMTVWGVTGALITTTGTVSINSTYTGSVGTRTFSFYLVSQFNVAIGSGTGNTMYLASGATDTVTLLGGMNSVDLTGMTFTLTLQSGITIAGPSFIIPATGGTVSPGTGLIEFNGAAVGISVNRAIDNPFFFSSGCVCTLLANLTTGSTRSSTMNSATLVLNGYQLTTGTFAATIASARTIAFGTTGVINVTGTGTVWNTGTITLLTITGIPVVNVTSTGSTAITVSSGALPDAQAISFNFTGGTYALTFLASGTATAKNVDYTGFAGTLGAIGTSTIYGNYTLSTGMTITATANTYNFSPTNGNTSIITSKGKTLNSITVAGSGGVVGLGDALTLTTDLLVNLGTFNTNNYNVSIVNLSSFATTTTRAINLGSSTVTMSGTFRVNTIGLTFNAGTSTINYTGFNDVLVDNGSVTGLTFYNLIYNVTASTSKLMTGKNTFNNLTLFTNNSDGANGGYVITNDIVVNGDFTIPTPIGAIYYSRFLLTSATIGTQVKITVYGDISPLSYVNFRDINAQGKWLPWTGTLLGNIGNNNNIAFSPGVNKYWSLAVGGSISNVAWALTSGGTPSSVNVPLPQDTIVIDNNGLNASAIITFNRDLYFTTINMASRTTAFTLSVGTLTNIYCSGNWINGSGLTSVTGTAGTVYFSNSLLRYVQSITSAAKLFSPKIIVSTNGIVQLLADLDQDSTVGLPTFTLTQGTINLNGFNLSTSQFISSGTLTRAINFGSTFINLTHTTAGTTVLSMATATNFSATGAGGFRANMSVTRTFSCGNSGAPTVAPNLFIFTGASIPTITTLSYFNTLDFTGSTCSPATSTVNVVNATLATGIGVFTALTLNCSGSGTITTNAKTIAAVTVLSGSPIISGTCTCTTFTVNGGTLTAWGGTIVPTGSFIVTTGNVFLSNGGTLTVTTITQNGGGVYLTASFTMTAGTSTYTFNAGTLSIYNTGSNQTLSVGRFISNGTGVRFLQLYGYIRLTNATAAALAVDMATTTNLIVDYGTFYSPAAGFLTVGTVAQTYTIGTTGGSVNNAISITWDSGGTAIPTITTGSWFANFDPSAAGAFTIAATTINIANSVTLSSAGTWTNCSFNLRGSGTFNSNTKSCATLTLNSVGAYSLAGAAILCVTYQQTAGSLFCGNSLTCSGTATFSGGSFGISNGTLACTTFTVNGGTHVWAGGNGTLTASVGIVVSAGSFTYSTGTISAISSWTIQSTGSVTFASNYALSATGTFTLSGGSLIINPGVTLTVGIFSSSSAGTRSIAFGNNVTAGNISLAHTTAGTEVMTFGSGPCTFSGVGGFTAVMNITRTFRAQGGTNAAINTYVPLSILSGASVPTFIDSSYFTRLNFGSSTVTPSAAVNPFILILGGDNALNAGGTFTNCAISYRGAVPGTFTTSGKTISSFSMDSTTSANTVCTLNGSLTMTGSISMGSGTLNILGYTVTAAGVISNSSFARSIIGSNGTININSSSGWADVQAGNLFTAYGFTLNFISTVAVSMSFSTGSNLQITINQGGTGSLTFSQLGTNPIINNITNTIQPCTVTFTSGQSFTFNNFNLRGTAGNLVTVNSSSAGTRATIRKASGTVYGEYLSIQDINATGVIGQSASAPTWYAGPTSTNVSNNTGWIFTRLPIISMSNVSIDASNGGITFGDQPV